MNEDEEIVQGLISSVISRDKTKKYEQEDRSGFSSAPPSFASPRKPESPDGALSPTVLLGLCGFPFGWSVFQMVYLSVLLPRQIETLVDYGSQGTSLGLALLGGSLVSLLAPPFLGAWSDALGKRKPFMYSGMLITFVCSFCMPAASTLATIAITHTVLVFGSTLFSTAFNAVVPEMVPRSRYGTSSGFMGATSVAGMALGSGMGPLVNTLGIFEVYWICSSLTLLCSVVTAYTVVDPPPEEVAERLAAESKRKQEEPATNMVETFIKSVSQSRDFALICFSRFFVQLGVYSIQEFLYWWVRDVVPVRGMIASAQAAMLFVPLAITALISAVLTGMISDRAGGKRKGWLIVSSLGMSGLMYGLAFVRDFPGAVFVFSFFGLFLGGFLALEFAVVYDVLPDHSPHMARDLGIYHLFIVLPNLFAAPCAGALLDHFTPRETFFTHPTPVTGYVALFCMVASYFLIAAGLFAGLRNVK